MRPAGLPVSAASAAPVSVEVAPVLALHPALRQFDRAALWAIAAPCGFARFTAGDTIALRYRPRAETGDVSNG